VDIAAERLVPPDPAQRSGQLLEILRETVGRDLERGAGSIIDFFLTRDLTGGWESWLQVEFAQLAIARLPLDNFAREQTFPTGQRCDLWFHDGGDKGVPIWVELKTQRNRGYTSAVRDFGSDITKLDGLPTAFRKVNVLVAAVVLRLRPTDPTELDTLRIEGRAGSMRYYRRSGGTWVDVTDEIRSQPVGATICASFVPATPMTG
jgi:hypothetical protein